MTNQSYSPTEQELIELQAEVQTIRETEQAAKRDPFETLKEDPFVGEEVTR
jgi:hypothetical protein